MAIGMVHPDLYLAMEAERDAALSRAEGAERGIMAMGARNDELTAMFNTALARAEKAEAALARCAAREWIEGPPGPDVAGELVIMEFTARSIGLTKSYDGTGIYRIEYVGEPEQSKAVRYAPLNPKGAENA